MVYQIVWSPDARQDYLNILEYLSSNWSNQEALRFIDRTEKVLSLVADNPLLFVFTVPQELKY